MKFQKLLIKRYKRIGDTLKHYLKIKLLLHN